MVYVQNSSLIETGKDMPEREKRGLWKEGYGRRVMEGGLWKEGALTPHVGLGVELIQEV